MIDRLSERGWRVRVKNICATMALLTAVGAHASDGSDASVTIDRVALFKNGLGYFTSSVTLPDGATTVRLGQFPVPSHGTFWVDYPKEVKVRSLLTSMEDVEDSVPVRNMFDLLRANVGMKVAVGVGSKDQPEIRGTLVNVMSEGSPPETPSPYVMDVRRPPSAHAYSPYGVVFVAVVRTETGTVALTSASITRVDFEDVDITTSVSGGSKRPSIRVELEEAAGGKEIQVSYLARGMTWLPSYRVDISDPQTARLSAKAIVVNEVADLRGVQLQLVTGFPNLEFGEVTSPVAMSQDLAGLLNALTARRSEASNRGHLMQQQALTLNYFVGGDQANPSLPGYSTARDGQVFEDLFLYPLDHVTLARQETACFPLFTANVPYRHVYTWKIPDMLDEDERYQRDPRRGEERTAEEVWHSCRMTNNMKMPWTTAAAEFINDGQIIGQDTCYYTAPGVETTIRINRAMNLLAEAGELELQRERNAQVFHGTHYDLVKVKGELKLHNRLDRSATVEVTKNLSGQVGETTPEAKDRATAKGLKRVNPRHVLVWEIELKPGQKEVLSYQYDVYVRN